MAFFLEITAFLGQKMRYCEMISSDDLFFLEITRFSEHKVHYSGTIPSDDLFFRDHLESRTKIGLEHHDIRTKN